MTQDSHIVVSKGGTTFVGPDATELYRVMVLRSQMILYKAGLKPSRGVMSGTQALKLASRYTGMAYKRGQFDAARADLTVWIDNMQAALPIEKR